MAYYKAQLVLSSGILIGVWANLVYQMNGLKFNNFKNFDGEELIQNLKNTDIVL